MFPHSQQLTSRHLFAVVVASLLLLKRSNFFSVHQLNPQVHQDSLTDISLVRDQVLANNNTETNEQANSNSARVGTASNARRRSQISCPICLCHATLPIETNCGHIFCANCVVQYWRHATSNIFHSKMKCPMCRQLVTCLLALYSQEEKQANMPQHGEVFSQINKYNKRFSGAPRNYWDYISDLPILLRHAINELFTLNDLNIWYRIRFAFMAFMAFCYFISPLDLIPEAFFGVLGFFDDMIVLLFIALYLCSMYRQIIANRN